MRLSTTGRAGALAPALPMPYPQLERLGLKLRQGQLSMTVAAPGVGKSQLWNNLAQRMGVPTIFWSADTDQHDVLLRSVALWSGSTIAEAETNLADESWRGWYAEKVSRGSHIEWIFDPAIRGEILVERMAAFAEIRGVHPQLVVVDNLANTNRNQADELAEQKEFIVEAQKLARSTGAHVAVLAHAKGEYDNGTKPIPLNGVLNNVTKIPEVMLSLHRANDAGTLLGVNLTKNRGGKSDPSAKQTLHLEADYERGSILGFRTAA